MKRERGEGAEGGRERREVEKSNEKNGIDCAFCYKCFDSSKMQLLVASATRANTYMNYAASFYSINKIKLCVESLRLFTVGIIILTLQNQEYRPPKWLKALLNSRYS